MISLAATPLGSRKQLPAALFGSTTTNGGGPLPVRSSWPLSLYRAEHFGCRCRCRAIDLCGRRSSSSVFVVVVKQHVDMDGRLTWNVVGLDLDAAQQSAQRNHQHDARDASQQRKGNNRLLLHRSDLLCVLKKEKKQREKHRNGTQRKRRSREGPPFFTEQRFFSTLAEADGLYIPLSASYHHHHHHGWPPPCAATAAATMLRPAPHGTPYQPSTLRLPCTPSTTRVLFLASAPRVEGTPHNLCRRTGVHTER